MLLMLGESRICILARRRTRRLLLAPRHGSQRASAARGIQRRHGGGSPGRRAFLRRVDNPDRQDPSTCARMARSPQLASPMQNRSHPTIWSTSAVLSLPSYLDPSLFSSHGYAPPRSKHATCLLVLPGSARPSLPLHRLRSSTSMPCPCSSPRYPRPGELYKRQSSSCHDGSNHWGKTTT
jgi:hypothetical protein